MEMKQWYIICTKPKQELKVSEALSKRKFEFYYPFVATDGREGGKKRELGKYLFPQYIFVYATLTDLKIIEQVEGVKNFMFWLNSLVCVKNQDVLLLKQFLKDYGDLALTKIPVDTNKEATIHIDSKNSYLGNSTNVINHSSKFHIPVLGLVIEAKHKKHKIKYLTPENTKSPTRLTESNN